MIQGRCAAMVAAAPASTSGSVVSVSTLSTAGTTPVRAQYASSVSTVTSSWRELSR